MAKVIITVDTGDSKTLSVSIDGQSVPNVTDASVYRELDSNGNVIRLSASIYTKEEMDNGVVKRISYYSDGSAEAQKIIASGNGILNKDIPNFVGVINDVNVKQQICEYFDKIRHRGV